MCDISDKKATFHTHNEGEHFCEVELLQMLGSEGCSTCDHILGSENCNTCDHDEHKEDSQWRETK